MNTSIEAPNNAATESEQAPQAAKRPLNRSERIEELLLIGSLDAAQIRARLLEEGYAKRLGLEAVEAEIQTIRERWHAATSTRTTLAAERQLARYRNLYERALALADGADSPKAATDALALAMKVNDAEARLLGVHRPAPNWLAAAERAEQAAAARRAEREAKEALERERKEHNERRALWPLAAGLRLLGALEEALPECSSELDELARLAREATHGSGREEILIDIAADDPWVPDDLKGETGVEAADLDAEMDAGPHYAKALWSGLVRKVLADRPGELERALAGIAECDLPECPAYWPPEEPERPLTAETLLSRLNALLPGALDLAREGPGESGLDGSAPN